MTTDPLPPETPDTAARQRTRRAVLEAAVSVWAKDFAAPLGTIADAAGVSRSTLHRYFPDRQSLLSASVTDAVARLERSYVEATAHVTTAMEELEASMRASVRLGDAVIFLYSDPTRFGDHPWSEHAQEDPESVELIERAQAEGGLAADMEAHWILGAYYSLVYVAAESISSGALSPHRAEELAWRSFRSGCTAG